MNNLEDRPENTQDQLIFHIILDESVPENLSTSLVTEFTSFNLQPKVRFKFNTIRTTSQQFSSTQEFDNNGHDAKSPYYRLIFDRLLPADFERLLYMDSDMLVRTDIRKIFQDYPMQDEILCAVSTNVGIFLTKTPFAPEPLIELPSKQEDEAPLTFKQRDYFNSGLLLINVQKWREHQVEQRALAVADKWITRQHDQDLLNYICQGHVTYMDWRWNLSFAVYLFGQTKVAKNMLISMPFNKVPLHASAPDSEHIESVINTPYIAHFTEDKP